VKYDYPIVESIRSILPVVDEYVVCLGDSEDETENLVRSIGSEKIKIIHSVWDKTCGGWRSFSGRDKQSNGCNE
jgi:hypothetical protein